MTPLAITTSFEQAPRVGAGAVAGLGRRAFERDLQQYVGTHGWTLGTLLASMLLAIMTLMSGRRAVGAVLFGCTKV
jgi:hypothetical protein